MGLFYADEGPARAESAHIPTIFNKIRHISAAGLNYAYITANLESMSVAHSVCVNC